MSVFFFFLLLVLSLNSSNIIISFLFCLEQWLCVYFHCLHSLICTFLLCIRVVVAIVLVFPLTKANVCAHKHAHIHGILVTPTVCMRVCVCILYTYCVYSRTFLLRKTYQTQREILCEMQKNWLNWLVGRSLIYFQSIWFYTLDISSRVCVVVVSIFFGLQFRLFDGRELNASVKIVKNTHTPMKKYTWIHTHARTHTPIRL